MELANNSPPPGTPGHLEGHANLPEVGRGSGQGREHEEKWEDPRR